MQTSAIKCNLSLKDDKLVKFPERCIFLASSDIALNSLLIALCQCNISFIGCIPPVSKTSLDSKYFLFPTLEDSHAQFILSICWINVPVLEPLQHWS